MTARNIISPLLNRQSLSVLPNGELSETMMPQRNYVEADASLFDTFSKFMDSDRGVMAVVENEKVIGYIDQKSMLEALHKVLISRDDCSIVEIECSPEDYCASRIAHAVEDADANLFDMLSHPGDDGKVRVLLRVGHMDPSAVVRSLERYEFVVTEAFGSRFDAVGVACERLAELAHYLNI